MATTYLGLDTNDLANFKLATTLGFAVCGGLTLGGRLGTALAAHTDAASRAMARLIESARTAEEPFIAECYRSAKVNQHLLSIANGVAD